jgi:hypothetical protein
MKGVYVKRNPTIKLDLTADDWQLYSGDDYPYRDSVTVSLNRGIEDILNTSSNFYSREEKIKKCNALLGAYSNYGAADSEGYAVLDTILCEFYGRWDYHEEEVA